MTNSHVTSIHILILIHISTRIHFRLELFSVHIIVKLIVFIIIPEMTYIWYGYQSNELQGTPQLSWHRKSSLNIAFALVIMLHSIKGLLLYLNRLFF